MFLLITRFRTFVTIRERYNLGGFKRFQVDFLDYCKEDIIWWVIAVIKALLTIFTFVGKTRSFDRLSSYLGMIIIVVHLLVEFLLVFFIFF